MAITKILNIMESEGRNPTTHLKNALEYIQNPDKTEECVLVGGINCLPDTAFEQMEETKNIFNKTGKRQGYHVIISFSPEEKVTAEQAMYVLEHFAKDVLGDDYEAVYAVHTDREHMHGHLIWNSVSMTTGKKYNSPKGNWKNHLQPITNKYCDELGLTIMPAEYSRNHKNISRDKWEKEMSMKEIILRDAKMCAYAAGNVEHFKYLMKRLGYVFKKDAWMEVQAPGFRYYHKLAKLDEMFSEETLRHHVDMPWMAKPYFYSSDIRGLHRVKLSPFQKKFYAKLYRLRIVEQKRFVVGGAKYTEDLKRFHQLQDEYLLLVNNDIKSVVELVDFIGEQKEKIQQIEDRQHEIYRESSSRKRSIKNEEQYREYQIWHVEVQEELDELKQEKKEIKKQLQLADGIIKEDLYTAYYAVSGKEEIVADRDVEIPGMEKEADQAGINTANVNSSTIKTINRLIRDLVNGKNEKSQEISNKYKAMNYIGYTATPYANILNEAGEDSLYPRNFISTLSVSKEYFGPQQIFGFEGGDYDYDGLDIVRIIDEDDLQAIKEIHEEGSPYVPLALQDAICWFLCGVACMRIWGYGKPISMLIHTSQKTDHHQNIAEAVRDWIVSKDVDEMIRRCEKVWNTETSQFTFEKFREQYPQYDRKDEEINRYPSFEDIRKEITILLSKEPTNIPLDEDDEFAYHEGIHMCIDNCKNNGITDDGMYVRLAYPTADNMPTPAPAFIVVGGATLSRGLTIEGLISTFFLRSVSQADTLMQMGRWFGYRKGYELLPRLWITSKTNDQFKFLAALDQELRDEIHEMDTLGKSPANYGPRVKNTPKASFIRITAKNRMQSAQATDMDFSGSFNQTYLFDNDVAALKHNIVETEKFIASLGQPEERKECNQHAENTFIWRNVEFSLVKKYLEEYKFNSRLGVFNDIASVIAWIEKISAEGKLENWNIILAGKGSGSVWNSPVGPVKKVSRTRKKLKNESDTVINIGVLRDPKDIIADIDLEGQPQEIVSKVKDFKSKYAKEIRSLAGLDSTPQMIVYIIDKDSKAVKGSDTREDLNSVEDIVGICMNIPGGKRGTDYTATVSIHMQNNPFDDEGDLEGTNEN